MPQPRTRVLITDDRPDKRLALEAVLASLPVDIAVAASGAEALQIAQGAEFAVILMDVRMPGMDGFETAARLREFPQLVRTPIIFVSADEDDELLRRGYALGAVDYVRDIVGEVLRAKVTFFVQLYEQRKELEERQRIERRSHVQYTITRLLSQADRLQEALVPVMRTVGETFQWEWSALWMMGRDALVCSCTWHDPRVPAEALGAACEHGLIPVGEELPGRIFASGEPLWIPSLADSDLLKNRVGALEEGWKSAAGFPVLAAGQIVGIVECFSQTRREQDDEVLSALAEIGRNIGDAIARKQAEATEHAILQASLDAIITVDEADRVVEWNPAAERIFGYKRAEAIGCSMAELTVPERLRSARRWSMQQLGQSGESRLMGDRVEVPAMRSDGSEFPAELAIIQIDSDGPPLFTGYVRDITARKQAEERLRSAREEAEAANKAKDEFIAALSHELRTPLTPIVALLPTIISSKDVPEAVRSDLQMIKRNVDLEARLIDDLLDLTQITKGKLHLNLQRVDVHSLATSTAQVVQHDAAAKELTVACEFAAQQHHVWADRVRLQQVLWNLLKNAVKFTGPGGSVIVRTSNTAAGQLEISVQDTGVGVEPDHLERLFRPFEQEEEGIRGHRFGGLGLGLFISRSLVEQQGGRLKASSPGLGKGATFSVTLPVAQAETHSPAPQPSLGGTLATRKLRILLVEDHDNTREVLRRLLKSRGHEVKDAACAEAALSLAASNEFDLIISDIGLPDASGLELMPQLKSRYGLRGISISGYGMDIDLRNSATAGFSAHFVKPVDFQQLHGAVQRLAEDGEQGS
jgi:PAS domain S-box-containing protein